ncbi:tRNA lysidine(34) synthetase TilS [Bradyrhizobium sp. LHD-71]|uniref:tRNA lysidine(34) synthetase TilS n=1 Tax=Bradyrhizobium sp. LHD-71 TaxID=3072141 RepID=UPI00280F5805|nr:tRNA lysidine(34) synthetase TilS [Bradyrhizobium sp. LHD-71]MDQ8729004.1 tRNA lysidine(34) synthetase TilS [Bradyrhizobium sp. LHD-71]
MPRNGERPQSRLSRGPSPISSAEVSRLFVDLRRAAVLVLAVSGGPDSTALMWLAAQWRRRLRRGPELVAITVDHGLRKESRAEARGVKKLAATLGIRHTTLIWSGTKPPRGLPAAAREARYAMLADAARKAGAECILTAHTRDDQAETFLMRLSRGSGLAGLAAMARYSVRGDVVVVRPLLDMPKGRLIATLDKARISFADDPTNRDPAFTRPRWRQLMPRLEQEGIDARSIARLTARLARANAALEAVVHRAESVLVRSEDGGAQRRTIDASAFLSLPPEIRLRLLHRAVDRAGHEGPAELGKVETLLEDLTDALTAKTARTFRRTLAGALVGFARGVISIEPAPLRRR